MCDIPSGNTYFVFPHCWVTALRVSKSNFENKFKVILLGIVGSFSSDAADGLARSSELSLQRMTCGLEPGAGITCSFSTFHSFLSILLWEYAAGALWETPSGRSAVTF